MDADVIPRLASHPLQITKVPPATKYCSLFFFDSRLLPCIESLDEDDCEEVLRRDKLNLYPPTEGNLQMLALVCFWIASKIHQSKAVFVDELKTIASTLITDQHFTRRDFVEAEIILMKAIQFDLRTGPLIYYAVEGLLVKLRQTARIGKVVRLETCVKIIDLLYDLDLKEADRPDIPINEISSAVLAVAYVLCVPREKCNFPLLSWMAGVSPSKIQKKDIEDWTKKILCGILEVKMDTEESTLGFNLSEKLYGDSENLSILPAGF